MHKKIITAVFGAVLAVTSLLLYISSGINATANDYALHKNIPLPDEITIDYANWNFLSLVIHEKGWLDKEFGKHDVKINWIFNPGGNKAMEYLLSGSADIAAAADICPLISSINGNDIKTVYVIENNQQAILANKSSNINHITDLKGKNVAVTPVTQPYAFMLKSFEAAGLDVKEVNIVPLQHNDGKNQLIIGSVEGWSAPDPFWTQAEIYGARVIYTNKQFNGTNVLNVRNEFLKKYPEAIYKVIGVYEKARKWSQENPDDFIALIEKRTKVAPDLTNIMINKKNFNVGAVDNTAIRSLIGSGKVFQKAGIIKEDVDIEKAVKNIYDNSYYKEFTKRL